ncbi:MAG TPA: hypothetical protein VH143_11830 [Kofleriaceae bacterium]|nr:hypothetical protein [Kofleriaceae bacterium]
MKRAVPRIKGGQSPACIAAIVPAPSASGDRARGARVLGLEMSRIAAVLDELRR